MGLLKETIFAWFSPAKKNPPHTCPQVLRKGHAKLAFPICACVRSILTGFLIYIHTIPIDELTEMG